MTHFTSIHPYTQNKIQEYPLMDTAAVNQCLTQAAKGFNEWRQYSFAKRGEVLMQVAVLLMQQQADLARLITLEMGKVLAESMAEIEKCAQVCRYYAEHAERYLTDSPIEAGYSRSYIQYAPIGAVLGIMPWNFPFWQVFRYAAPVLMTGNVTLLKHAPNVCGCSKIIESLFQQAGAPEGVVQSLVMDTQQAEQVISAPIVQGVTFTGSNRAGSLVASLAGKYTKKSVLELGGSDALLVLADADLALAARTALQSRMLNTGQTCISAKRFVVVKKVADDFIEELMNGMQSFKQGNPFDAGISLGPLARPDLAENLMRQLKNTVKAGAQLLRGGHADGCNVAPSLLLNVQPGMVAFEEETFGPMACVTVAENEEQAVALTNSSPFGLAASIWSRDLEKAASLAREIEAGNVFINTLVKTDPRLPFGGTKQSGYGRELGREGILEFVNLKTIAIE